MEPCLAVPNQQYLTFFVQQYAILSFTLTKITKLNTVWHCNDLYPIWSFSDIEIEAKLRQANSK